MNHNGNHNGNYSARDVFGDTLRARRIAKDITQEEMAELLGVSLATISAWELGRYSPRENNLNKIEELLGQLDEVATTSKSEAGLPPPRLRSQTGRCRIGDWPQSGDRRIVGYSARVHCRPQARKLFGYSAEQSPSPQCHAYQHQGGSA